jgi:hypothetical protein
MNIKLIILCFLFLAIFSGCNKLGYKHIVPKLIAHLDSATKNIDSCLTSIHAVTDFEWDKMYLFEAGSSIYESKHSIQQVVGIWDDYIQDIPVDSAELVFVRKNKVVYVEVFNIYASSIFMPMPVDSSSFSNERKVYTQLLPFLDISKDSMFIWKSKIADSGRNPSFYDIICAYNCRMQSKKSR